MTFKNDSNSNSDSLQIKELIQKALDYKYLYIIFTVLCLTVAYGVNRYSETVYEASSVIGPIEDQGSGLLGSNELFSGLQAYTRSRNLEDDLNSIKSFSLVTTTINKLTLEVGYFYERKKIFSSENQIYNSAPFIVSIDKSHIQPIGTRFYVEIIDNLSYRLTVFSEEAQLYNYIDDMVIGTVSNLRIDTICRFNETVTNSKFKFALSTNHDFFKPTAIKDVLFFEFYNLERLTLRYFKNISANPVNMRSSLMNIRFQGENPDLTVDFLNSYIQTFLDENLSKKNQIAVNTIKFIDSQISEISDSLIASESLLRDYRSTNQVTDLSYQGQQALTQMSQIETDLSTVQVQERYYEYALDYINKNQDFAGLAPPSSANVVDPIMNTLILELLSLNAQRSAIISNKAEKNLFLGQIENKLILQKQTIIENVKNNLNTLDLTKNALNYRAEKLSKEISKLPRTELNMVSMQRKFDLTDAIYTFLLQKRSEAAITMASNYPDFQVIEPARKIKTSILSPRIRINWLIAIFFSIVIPSLFIYLKNFFNDKITSVREIEQITNRRVLSKIFTNPTDIEAVVLEAPGSAISESFRNLRSSLFIKFREKQLKVILVTSSQPKDGKSFISLNLATSIAMVGHNTVIIDGDLRKPTLQDKFGTEYSTGLTNYMADNTRKEDILHKTNIDNLSFIPAGPSLPNSSELIEAGSLNSLFEWLNNNFEYIVIDSPPAGIVSDSLMMMKYTSLILLVVRNGNTRKEDLSDVVNLFQMNNIEGFEVVFNDLDIKESRYTRYNQHYTNNKKRKLYGK